MKFYYLLALLVIPFASAHAEQFGISLSKSCYTMIANDMKTDCPTYEEIMFLFPDQTDQNMVGKFEYKDNVYQRGPSQLSVPERYYDFHESNMIWIDPPASVMSRIKMIYIEPSIPEYKTLDSKKMDDYTVSFGKDRYIDDSCKNIKITAENWAFLLGDTLHFLNNKCDYGYTLFDGTVTIQLAQSYQDITTSYKYQFDKWVAENLIKCKVRLCV